MRTAEQIRLIKQHPRLILPQVESDEIIEQRELYEDSLLAFARDAWNIVEPSQWIDSWHIEALTEHLEAVYYNDIKYLLINIPPRMGKSLMVNVFFGAWCLAKDPSARLFYTSYAEDLAKYHHIDCRKVIKSPWYQKYWGKKFSVEKDVDNLSHFATDKLGYRMTSTVGGKSTGFGADILFSDDANKQGDVHSHIMRDRVNMWWTRGMSMRWADSETFRRIVTQQRLHEMDLSGYILAQEVPNLVHFRLPMEYEVGSKCITVPLKSTGNKPWSDPRKKAGELLCPPLASAEVVKQTKAELGAYDTAGQLQQRPAAIDGTIFKRQYMQMWMSDVFPNIEYVIQSYDTAYTKTLTADDVVSGCNTAITTWGIFNDQHGITNVMLLNMFVGQLEHPELREMAQRLYRNYHDVDFEEPLGYDGPQPDLILIEAKANGVPLIQDLIRAGVPCSRFNPKTSKINRALMVASLFEVGRVWFPGKPPHYKKFRPYAEDFIEACLKFPKGASADIVDSMSQALIRIKESGAVFHPTDVREEEQYEWERNKDKLYDV
jgi:predicted phage terminase large subunit-like protein